jgi:putative DNA primase/helicase
MLLEIDFSPLTPQEIADAPKLPEIEELVPMQPVPANAPPLADRHPEYGAPTTTWTYLDAKGRLLGYIARYDTVDGLKVYAPWTFCRSSDTDAGAWRLKGFQAPYPLYNADDLATRRDVPVLIVHGEKAADAARELFPQYVVTTSPYGYALAHNADLSALEGRDIIISPDHSEEGPNMIEAYYKAV